MATISLSEAPTSGTLMGVFVSPRGHLVAYAPESIFRSPPPTHIQVWQIPRMPLSADLLATDAVHSLMLLKVNTETPHLQLATITPGMNERVLVVAQPRQFGTNIMAVGTVTMSSENTVIVYRIEVCA
jgi:hypothetical protein